MAKRLSGQQLYSVNITLNFQDVNSMFSPYVINIEQVFTMKKKFSIARLQIQFAPPAIPAKLM